MATLLARLVLGRASGCAAHAYPIECWLEVPQEEVRGKKGVTMRVGRLSLVVLLTAGFAILGGPAGAEGRPFATTLTGSAEVPGPGDPDASGTASITLNQGQGEVCFSLTWENIDGTVVASHIHEAPVGVAGPVVVPLFVDVSFSGTGSFSDCVTGVSEELIKDIRQNPAGYYVNIHSTVFPAGAIRGQLSK
jgi:hypothetical protein